MLKRYIRQHLRGILCFLLFTGIFTFIFYLYRLEIEAVLYAGMLCALIGLVVLFLDYRRYTMKHRQLKRIHDQMLAGLELLPEAGGLLEEDYQALIDQRLRYEKREMLKRDQQTGEMMEYYTLWAHQIKTPIAAMRLVLQEQENPEISTELFKIEQYVEMVLSYLRLDSTSTDFVIRRQDLEPIVKGAIRKYAPLFIRKKIALELEDVRCEILSDEKWLSFVIEQILSNALKYTSKGKIRVYMETGQTLVVEDTGIGIAPEDLPRLFEKGFTGYNGREDKRATGLGLYLSRRILKKLGHTIWITSEEGVGTRVHIGLEIRPLRTEE